MSNLCACGHDLEDHEKVRVTDGSGFDTFRRCAVPGCTCADEELREDGGRKAQVRL